MVDNNRSGKFTVGNLPDHTISLNRVFQKIIIYVCNDYKKLDFEVDICQQLRMNYLMREEKRCCW